MTLYTTTNPIAQELLYRMRNPNTDNPSFRSLIKDFGTFIGYEIASYLPKIEESIETCLGEEASHKILKSHPTLIGILRAGEPMREGMLRTFPYADVGFIGAMRDEATAKAQFGYLATPKQTNGSAVIVCDPMIATAGSMIGALELVKKQDPKKIIVAGVIASKEGIRRLEAYDASLDVFVGAVDPVLNSQKYIVPGLGDAGDRCYGQKLQCTL